MTLHTTWKRRVAWCSPTAKRSQEPKLEREMFGDRSIRGAEIAKSLELVMKFSVLNSLVYLFCVCVGLENWSVSKLLNIFLQALFCLDLHDHPLLEPCFLQLPSPLNFCWFFMIFRPIFVRLFSSFSGDDSRLWCGSFPNCHTCDAECDRRKIWEVDSQSGITCALVPSSCLSFCLNWDFKYFKSPFFASYLCWLWECLLTGCWLKILKSDCNLVLLLSLAFREAAKDKGKHYFHHRSGSASDFCGKQRVDSRISNLGRQAYRCAKCDFDASSQEISSRAVLHPESIVIARVTKMVETRHPDF